MIDKSDPRYLWVSQDSFDGDGSYERPFFSVEFALKKVNPGNTIVLKEGIYNDDVTIEISGTKNLPIAIIADDDAVVEIKESCWFLYDTSDLIISGITFKDAPFGAISVIGSCKRNRFEYLNFINCGTIGKASCTLFFGGAGAEFNIVENCTFTHDKDLLKKCFPENSLIALMVSDGDQENGLPITHHVFRRNKFSNYNYGILIGSSDSTDNLNCHVVEYNIVENCSNGGIIVKCGDTLVSGNSVKNCPNNSIKIAAGTGSIIEDNRIENCKHGIEINGAGHSVVNNCIVKCHEQAVRACAKNNEESVAASNLFIENNTFIYCGAENSNLQSKVSGVSIEPGTTTIIRKNLVYGEGCPFLILESVVSDPEGVENIPAEFVISENATSGNSDREVFEGFSYQNVNFVNFDEGNFENESTFGAQGWVLRPETFDPDIDVQDPESDTDYVEASTPEDDELNENFDIPEAAYDEENPSSSEDDDQENQLSNRSKEIFQQEILSSLFFDTDAEEIENPESPEKNDYKAD